MKHWLGLFKQEVRAFIDEYVHGDSRVALVRFAMLNKVEFNLNDTYSKEERLDILDDAQPMVPRYTFIYSALQ